MFEPEFKDKIVLVTGAAGVIGRWIVQGFARAGSRLVLSDHRPDVLAADAAALGLPTERLLSHATQLQDAAAITDLVAAVKETGLKLPLVVRLEGNNADAGRKTLAESGLSLTTGDSMADAAQKVVAAVGKA